MVFGGLSIDDAIRLYFEKQDALKRGDLTALRTLKQHYPQLFSVALENDMSILLDYVNKLRQMPDFQKRYKAFCETRIRQLKDLTLIDCENLK